jgi:hypothetical protein
MKFDKTNIQFNSLFLNIKKKIEIDLCNKNIESAIKHTLCLSQINFSYYIKYYDQDIENYIGEISKIIFPSKIVYKPKENNVVMIDSLALDGHGLTQQYLRAFMALKLNILYIVIGSANQCTDILKELNSYSNSKVVIISGKGNNLKEQILLIKMEIENFKAFKIFSHSFSVLGPIALKLLKTPLKYIINFGDHHCWSGTTSADYIIDFRNWGYSLSSGIRKFNKEKIIIQPYYPISDKNHFQGFPKLTKGKVIIFTGGANYKFEDENMTFFKILLRILNDNTEAIVLFACRGDGSIIREFIKKNELVNRLFLIDYRKDLSEVFKHIDIYLSTYPTGGGLMPQYAAINGRPILEYNNEENLNHGTIEYHDFTNLGHSYSTKYVDLELFYKEANRLIRDKDYRECIGSILKQFVISEDKFNKSVKEIYLYNRNLLKPENIDFDYESQRSEFSLVSFSKKLDFLSRLLYRDFSIKYLFKFPYKIVVQSSILALYSFIVKKLKNR